MRMLKKRNEKRTRKQARVCLNDVHQKLELAAKRSCSLAHAYVCVFLNFYHFLVCDVHFYFEHIESNILCPIQVYEALKKYLFIVTFSRRFSASPIIFQQMRTFFKPTVRKKYMHLFLESVGQISTILLLRTTEKYI